MPPETQHVLIVDDEPAIRKFLRISLNAHGFQTSEADCGSVAALKVDSESPDAVILDMGLPDISGIEVTRALRRTSWVPILFLSVHDDERTKIEALDAGADDYLTKPFSVEELVARLRAALRRKNAYPSHGVLRCGPLSLDPEKHQVTLDGQKVALTPNEFSLLHVLLKNQNKVVTHRQLLTDVWGAAYAEESQMLRVNIFNLRKKIERPPAVPRLLQTEPGIGYRLCLDS